MDEIRILEIKESVFADNDREAELLRQQLKAENTFLINNYITKIAKESRYIV